MVYTFGSGHLLKQISWSSTNATVPITKRRPLSIEIPLFKGNKLKDDTGAGSADANFMSDKCKFMYDSTYERALILGDRIYEGGKQICQRLAELRRQEKLNQEQPESNGDEESIAKDDRETCMVEEVIIHHVDFPSTDVISVMGRIVVHPERKDDRVAIVDFDEMTLRYTKLNFNQMKSWSVFPGQTVVLEGLNPRGNAFEVQKVHHERKLELPQAPIKLERELRMVIAAAPFTDKEDLLYEKLSDLLSYCSENSPDVLILTGPFGDSRNNLFSTIAETFEEYFEKIIANIMNSVSPTTEVLVVSNHEDIMSMFVYPSFPYKINRFFKNLHFLPDPCVVSINGLEVGITTVDIIKDLSDAEVSGAPMGDKVKRAFNYLFHHKSFYPLNPPPESVPLDVDLLNDFGNLPRVPNMMICPGDLKCYVRDVHGCVCINPGHLVDQTSGEGTFARVVVHPPEAESTAPMNYVVCQVVKS